LIFLGRSSTTSAMPSALFFSGYFWERVLFFAQAGYLLCLGWQVCTSMPTWGLTKFLP
jgi:hypothetical protein